MERVPRPLSLQELEELRASNSPKPSSRRKPQRSSAARRSTSAGSSKKARSTGANRGVIGSFLGGPARRIYNVPAEPERRELIDLAARVPLDQRTEALEEVERVSGRLDEALRDLAEAVHARDAAAERVIQNRSADPLYGFDQYDEARAQLRLAEQRWSRALEDFYAARQAVIDARVMRPPGVGRRSLGWHFDWTGGRS